MHSTSLSMVICMWVAVVAGCDSTNLSALNDDLRRRAIELEDEVEHLRRRTRELELEVRRHSAPGEPPEDRLATPHVTEVRIGRLSHSRDENDDGRPDLLVLYMSPVDGMGRFVQLVGELSVSASLIPADDTSTTIGLATLAPEELRDAYRSGVTGTHYTIELPIDPGDSIEDRCVVRAVYHDGRTGSRYSAERVIIFR